MMVIFRLLVSEFKTQTSTPPNPCGISCIVQLHAQGSGTTEGIHMTKDKEIIKYIIDWLDHDIDERDDKKDYYHYKNQLFYNASELKEKIEIALDEETTIEQIKEGEF